MTAVDARRIPVAAPPWIDTDDDRAARLARLEREITTHDENVRAWNRAIRQFAAELAGNAPDSGESVTSTAGNLGISDETRIRAAA